MNYHNITTCDMNNGDGLRTVLWVSGCIHHCPGCHNPQTWDYNSGIPFDVAAYDELIEKLKPDYISGLTLSGGDPLAPLNRLRTIDIVNGVRFHVPDKTIWIYTGYYWEEIKVNHELSTYLLPNVDVIVDGRFRQELADVNYHWAGSTNQRVIDVKKSLELGCAVMYESK